MWEFGYRWMDCWGISITEDHVGRSLYTVRLYLVAVLHDALIIYITFRFESASL